jgi:uncharacterized protein
MHAGQLDKDTLERWGFHDPLFADDRFLRLVDILKSLGSVAVAYSGGVDSTFLLRVARSVLGEKAIGVLAHSESLDRNELEDAKRTADAMGVPIRVIETREYDNPEYRKNDGSRCYHCKTELFSVVKKYALAQGISHVLDGSNADDQGDYRPGLRARNEQSVRSPLLEAGLDKTAIRRFSQALGLPTWDKPAAPCLSSRIPYGAPVTYEKLRQVEAAEMGLRALGFRVCRVRHHDQVARVEVPQDDLARLIDPAVRPLVLEAVKQAGFLFVAFDLEGFRSGSLNAGLSPLQRAAGTAVVPASQVKRL